MFRRTRRTSLVVAVLTLGGLAVAASANAAVSEIGDLTCEGQAPTIIAEDESVRGTRGPDVILLTGDGEQIVRGLAGDDLICGSSSGDTILGGAGDDKLFGDDGADQIIGGPGADLIYGDSGTDSLRGKRGEDSLVGGGGIDVLVPGAGDDSCSEDTVDTVVGECYVDVTSPQIVNVILPETVEAGTSLRASIEVADESGISGVYAYVGGASGWTEWCFAIVADAQESTDGNFIFEAICDVPSTTPNDEFSMFITAVDALGNSSYSSGVSYEFRVVGGSDDTTAPIVSSIVATYDDDSRSVTITWSTEDASGVQAVGLFLAFNTYRFGNDQGMSYGDYSNQVTRISGDEFAGTYSTVVELADFAPDGEYTLWFFARDQVSNRSFDRSDTVFTVS